MEMGLEAAELGLLARRSRQGELAVLTLIADPSKMLLCPVYFSDGRCHE